MTAQVLDLTSRLTTAAGECDCPAHHLVALAHRLHGYRAGSEGELLIPAEYLDTTISDALLTIRRVLEETGHDTEGRKIR